MIWYYCWLAAWTVPLVRTPESSLRHFLVLFCRVYIIGPSVSFFCLDQYIGLSRAMMDRRRYLCYVGCIEIEIEACDFAGARQIFTGAATEDLRP